MQEISSSTSSALLLFISRYIHVSSIELIVDTHRFLPLHERFKTDIPEGIQAFQFDESLSTIMDGTSLKTRYSLIFNDQGGILGILGVFGNIYPDRLSDKTFTTMKDFVEKTSDSGFLGMLIGIQPETDEFTLRGFGLMCLPYDIIDSIYYLVDRADSLNQIMGKRIIFEGDDAISSKVMIHDW